MVERRKKKQMVVYIVQWEWKFKFILNRLYSLFPRSKYVHTWAIFRISVWNLDNTIVQKITNNLNIKNYK